MLKSLLRRALAALGLSMLLVAVPTSAATPQHARPALWAVSDADTTIYLFGTIHLLPDTLEWRTPTFNKAVDGSSQLVVETIIDQQNPQAFQAIELQLGVHPGLPPIVDRVPPATVPRLRAAIAKTGIPEQAFDRMETWLAAIQLLAVQFREMGLKGSDGPEEILRQTFLTTHRPIGELETNLDQLKYFDTLSEQAQRELLQGSVEEPDSMVKEFGGMLTSWSKGDVKGIAKTFDQDLAASPELRQALILQRNANWSKWIERRMAQPGQIMIAVGAGHLAGPDSVIALLKKDGYRVRRVQ